LLRFTKKERRRQQLTALWTESGTDAARISIDVVQAAARSCVK
jgi:hypothetical protein